MKKLIFLISALAMLGVVLALPNFTSGSKAVSKPIDTSTTISFSQNPVPAGTTVTITATVTPNPGVANGKLEIGIRQNPGTGEYKTCANPGNSFAVKLTPANGVDIDANGQVSVQFDTINILPGTMLALSARYVPAGGSGYAQSESLCTDLTVTDPIITPPPCSGLTIAASFAGGNGTPAPGNAGPWTFKIRVDNCTGVDLTNVKVQGGSNGWTEPSKTTAAVPDGTYTVKTNKGGAQTITWFVDLPSGSYKEILVTVDGKVPNSAACDSIRFISGAWSAVYDTGDGLGSRKSEYTGRVTTTVTCP
jgi:hypothetical protein